MNFEFFIHFKRMNVTLEEKIKFPKNVSLALLTGGLSYKVRYKETMVSGDVTLSHGFIALFIDSILNKINRI